MAEKLNKKIEQEQWVELYEYIRKEILGYDKSLQLPRIFILRLKGLREGKFCANTKSPSKSLGDYPYKSILIAFKMCKMDLIRVLSTKTFKDEAHKVNYLMAIIESKINDICIRIKKVENAQEKGEHIKINNDDNKAEYKHKTKEVKNSRLKHLL